MNWGNWLKYGISPDSGYHKNTAPVIVGIQSDCGITHSFHFQWAKGRLLCFSGAIEYCVCWRHKSRDPQLQMSENY